MPLFKCTLALFIETDQLVLDVHTLRQTNKTLDAELGGLKSEYAALREKHEKLSAESSHTIESNSKLSLCRN